MTRGRVAYSRHTHAFVSTVRHDGPVVALVSLGRSLAASRIGRWFHRAIGRGIADRLGLGRDPGERAAERFLRTLGYQLVARNWRSPRDRRDEVDLIVRTPDRSEIVLVEVKRTASQWDPLARVDRRKREVLWRIALDLEALARSRSTTRVARATRPARASRNDLVAVGGSGRLASVCDHLPGVLTRSIRGDRLRGRPECLHQARPP